MRTINIQKLILPIGTFLSSIVMMIAFQNCGNDAAFTSEPSANQNNRNNGGTIYGGNGDIVIQINEYPVDGTNEGSDGRSNLGGPAVIDFSINQATDPSTGNPLGSPIVNVRCELDGVAIACNKDDRIPIGNLSIGDHTFEIIAVNEDGQEVSHTLTWTIHDEIIQITRDINVNVINDKADIMIIVDNSGSMEFEQRSMADRVGNMIRRFSGLDYRISVITTNTVSANYPESLNYVDGKFLMFDDGSYCLSGSSYGADEDRIQQKLGDIVKRSERGNGWERGVYTSYRALERYQNGQNSHDCFRTNTAKHFIVISDENETLTTDQGRPLDLDRSFISSDVNQLKNLISNLFGPQTVFKFHSIIVDPTRSEGQNCLSDGNGEHSLGTFYAQMSQATGGVIGSVCAIDYATQLEKIGQAISDSAKSYQLACVAVPNLNGEWGSVLTLPSGTPVELGWSFESDKVEFSSLLPAGNYRATHYCFK